MISPLGIAMDFLEKFGFFDVVLPFLLVFTLIFAILEKTKILGTEKVKGEVVPRRNINSMASFAIAMFVVAAGQIVEIIRQALPMIILILIALISFMMLAGSLMSNKEFNFEERKGWKVFLTIVLFISVILIFLGVIKHESGYSWLSIIWNYIVENWTTGPLVSSMVFLGIIVLVIWFVMKKPSGENGGSNGT